MSSEVRCPQCDQPLTQVGQFCICPEHGQIRPETLAHVIALITQLEMTGHTDEEVEALSNERDRLQRILPKNP